LKSHPFFIGCQFHPEFSSTFDKSDNIFVGLIKKCIINKYAKKI
jgi:CTP synthase